MATQATKKARTAARALAGAGKGQVNGFLDFIRTQGVIGLAVGLVLGGAVSTVVKSLVDNVVMPPIGILLGSTSGLKGLSVTVGHDSDGVPAVLHYGLFVNDLINFVIIAFVIYLILHWLKLDRLDKKKA